MSFNMNLAETTRLLKEATKRKQLEEAAKEAEKIKEKTLVLTEEQQKELEQQTADWSKFNAKETEDELSKYAYQLTEKEMNEVKAKVENLMPYIYEDLDD